MARNRVPVGILLIGIAIVLLLGKLGVFGFLSSLLWPILLLIPAAALYYLYLNRTLPSVVLVPAGVLLTYGLMFLFCNLFGWGTMAYIWPGFLFGFAVGLYSLYTFDRHANRSVLTFAIVLGVISLVLFAMKMLFSLGIYLIAAIFILLGIFFLIGRSRS
jgi:hypothetical protein